MRDSHAGGQKKEVSWGTFAAFTPSGTFSPGWVSGVVTCWKVKLWLSRIAYHCLRMEGPHIHTPGCERLSTDDPTSLQYPDVSSAGKWTLLLPKTVNKVNSQMASNRAQGPQKSHRIVFQRDLRENLVGAISNLIYKNLRNRRLQSFKHLIYVSADLFIL